MSKQKDGYNKNSKYKNEPYIDFEPNGNGVTHLTTKNVEDGFQIIAVNKNKSVVMQPGYDYFFSGSVREIPLKTKNKDMYNNFRYSAQVGGQPPMQQQQPNEQDMIMQVLQAYFSMVGMNEQQAQEFMQEFGAMQPEEQQQILSYIQKELQGSQQQQSAPMQQGSAQDLQPMGMQEQPMAPSQQQEQVVAMGGYLVPMKRYAQSGEMSSGKDQDQMPPPAKFRLGMEGLPNVGVRARELGIDNQQLYPMGNGSIETAEVGYDENPKGAMRPVSVPSQPMLIADPKEIRKQRIAHVQKMNEEANAIAKEFMDEKEERKNIQKYLVSKGYNLGAYVDKTDKEGDRIKGVDGVFGSRTLNALNKEVNKRLKLEGGTKDEAYGRTISEIFESVPYTNSSTKLPDDIKSNLSTEPIDDNQKPEGLPIGGGDNSSKIRQQQMLAEKKKKEQEAVSQQKDFTDNLDYVGYENPDYIPKGKNSWGQKEDFEIPQNISSRFNDIGTLGKSEVQVLYDPVEGTVLLKNPNNKFTDITDNYKEILPTFEKGIIETSSNKRWKELKKLGAWSGKKDRLYIIDQKEIEENNKAIARLRRMYKSK